MTPSTATRRLRWRLTALSVTVMALVLGAMALTLFVVQRHQLLGAIDIRLERRVELARIGLATGEPSLPPVAPEDELTQVVSSDGLVLAATPNAAGLPAVVPPPDGARQTRTVDGLPIEDDRFRVLSVRVDAGSAPVVVHVAENIDDMDEALQALAVSLLVALPAVLVAVALLTWWLVGRTLRPVEQAAVRQARFVSDASHELRSPLARMRTRLEVDLAHPRGVELHDTAAALLGETRAMQHLVDDLLVLARDDEVGVTTTRAQVRVDLDDIVLAEAALHRSGGRVRVDTTGVSGGLVVGDTEDFTRIVRNLLDNAVRHAAHRVTVTLMEDRGEVVLTVDDDGPGIPAEQRAEVFERFARLDSARTPGSGSTGLGLAIARELTFRHRGSVDLGEAPLGGARFTVRLPSA